MENNFNSRRKFSLLHGKDESKEFLNIKKIKKFCSRKLFRNNDVYTS